MPCRPPSGFLGQAVGFDVAHFHHLSHKHSSTCALFEAAHFRF
jgi:hypothetical protein